MPGVSAARGKGLPPLGVTRPSLHSASSPGGETQHFAAAFQDAIQFALLPVTQSEPQVCSESPLPRLQDEGLDDPRGRLGGSGS